MGFEFVHQPYSTGFDLRDFMTEVSVGGFSELDIVSAWVKRSGVNALQAYLTELRNQGATIRSIIGISQGGTSIQGLQDLVALSDEAYVFHQKGRTFHPKVYRSSSKSQALTLVGSHNFTAGGAGNNFEAGTLGRLNFTSKAEAAYHQTIRQYVDTLIADTSVCKLIDPALLQNLIANNRYRLIDETKPTTSGDDPDNPQPPAGASLDPPLFGSSSATLRNVPKTGTRKAVAKRGAAKKSGPRRSSGHPASTKASPPPTAGGSGSAGPAVVSRRWYKRNLGKIDAQHGTSKNWHPSKRMTLVDGGHPIDRTTYFRQQFFSNAAWTTGTNQGGKQYESADIEMEVFVKGASVGTHHLRPIHTPDYHSDEGNRATELHWGSLQPHMRSVNHTGEVVTLEKLSDGTWRLHFGPTETGPFIY